MLNISVVLVKWINIGGNMHHQNNKIIKIINNKIIKVIIIINKIIKKYNNLKLNNNQVG
jgi:hypothetical protein